MLWPEYFDLRRTRSEGRKVKRAFAVSDPTLEILTKAVERLGLQYKAEPEKAYPANWWNQKGRILVEKSMPKSKLLEKVGSELSRIQRS